jgi:hypothetical protein
MKWEDEIIKIIEQKEKADLKEAAKLFRAAGRSGPCNHFHPFPPECGLKRELDCLTLYLTLCDRISVGSWVWQID